MNNKTASLKTISLLESHDSLYIANLKRQANNTTFVIIATDTNDANRLYHELSLFLPTYNINIFDDNELLPYERLSPQKSIIASRITTLWQILFKKIDI